MVAPPVGIVGLTPCDVFLRQSSAQYWIVSSTVKAFASREVAPLSSMPQ